MAIDVSKLGAALKPFDLAEFCEVDCGTFDLKMKQAAYHNQEFRAQVSARALRVKRKSLTPTKGSMTGDFEEDVRLFVDLILVGYGKRPLKDADGAEVPYSAENMFDLFTKTGKPGRVMFGKIMAIAADDESFSAAEEDVKNS